ncbi:MAG TPA: ATP-binding cassette domain-containing protein [Microbacterium sp.]|nr:ATP-binding cassette domain-containing protein [Microbacterium sp.]
MGDVAPAVPNDDAFVEESVEEGSEAEEAVVEEPVVEDAAEEKAFTEEVSVGETPVEAIEVVAPESSASEAPLDMTAPDDASVQDVVDAPSDETHAVPLPEPAPLEHAVEEPSVEASAPSVAPTNASAEAIRIRGLVKIFGDHVAVNGIDLTVPAGSFYGIVGPNGAGKTTTLSIVAGLLRADSGDIVICGIDQSAQPLAAKRVMGVLPDRLRTFDRLTGRQLLYYYGLLRGLASNVIEKRVADLARAFDLGDALSRVVSDYSAGMTKKIMLAGAMIHSPRVLVLDEPFEAVDPVSSAVILDILRAYVAHGGTVILSSHGMDLVERVCSRVAIIVGGDVLAEGTIDEVRAGQTLESRFVELAGSSGEVEGLEWLHTFSD